MRGSHAGNGRHAPAVARGPSFTGCEALWHKRNSQRRSGDSARGAGASRARGCGALRVPRALGRKGEPCMRLETLLPLGKVDPGLRAPETGLDLAAVAADARLLEDIGYDGVAIEETKQDPYIVMALAAAATTRLRVSTAIAMAFPRSPTITAMSRSEEHTSELQSLRHIVCRLLLEK